MICNVGRHLMTNNTNLNLFRRKKYQKMTKIFKDNIQNIQGQNRK